MALPSIEQVSQNINGVNVQCAHITCPAAACFRMENVLDTISSGSFTFQSVMKSNAAHKIIVAVGNVSASFDLTSSWVKYVSVYENVDPQAAGRDMIIFFPAGEYWLYHTMLEHGTKASDWKVSPEDTEEQIAQIYVEIREQYTQIMSDMERILLEAVSSYVKISDFETFRTDNTAAIELMADEIRQTVAETYETKNDAGTKYEQYESEIAQNARNITLKVSATDYTAAIIAAMINAAGSNVIIEADHIQLAGNVVLKNNLTDGTTQISGNNIKTGTISADRIGANTITVDKLSGQIKDSGNTWAINLTNGTMTIGDISASNIKTGTMSADRIHGGSIDAKDVTINNLNAAKITVGILDVARIPDLSADKITSGTISADRIAANSVAVSKLTGSITNGGWSIDLTNGTFTIGKISATKITAGTITGAVTATNLTMTGGKISIDAGNAHTADAFDNYITLQYGYILYDTTYKRTATFNSKAFKIEQSYDPSISIRYTTGTEQTEGKYTARQICKSLVNGSTISDYEFEAGWEGIILTSNGSNVFKAVTDGSTQSSINQVILGHSSNCSVILPSGNTYVGDTELNAYIDGRTTKTAVKEIFITGITGATITAYYARYGNLCVINFAVTKNQSGSVSTSKTLSGITGAKTNYPAYCGLSGYDNGGKVAGGHMWLDGTTLNIRISPTDSATAYLKGVMVYSVS